MASATTNKVVKIHELTSNLTWDDKPITGCGRVGDAETDTKNTADVTCKPCRVYRSKCIRLHS